MRGVPKPIFVLLVNENNQMKQNSFVQLGIYSWIYCLHSAWVLSIYKNQLLLVLLLLVLLLLLLLQF